MGWSSKYQPHWAVTHKEIAPKWRYRGGSNTEDAQGSPVLLDDWRERWWSPLKLTNNNGKKQPWMSRCISYKKWGIFHDFMLVFRVVFVIFTLIFGKMIHNLTNIFQMGWNHPTIGSLEVLTQHTSIIPQIFSNKRQDRSPFRNTAWSNQNSEMG